MSFLFKLMSTVVVLLVAAWLAASWLGGGALDDHAAGFMARLEAEAKPLSPAGEQALAQAPPVVREYLGRAVPAGAGPTRLVTITQSGWAKPRPNWPRLDVEGRQVYSLNPPGLVWTARLQLFPLMWLGVVDSYVSGQGVTDSKVLGLLSVLRRTGTAIDRDGLLRWLAEAPLFPDALLPRANLRWQSETKHSARITLFHGKLKVSGVFYFSQAGDPQIFVTPERERDLERGLYQPQLWTMRYFDFHEQDGWRVPGRLRATWHGPAGDFVQADMTIHTLERR